MQVAHTSLSASLRFGSSPFSGTYFTVTIDQPHFRVSDDAGFGVLMISVPVQRLREEALAASNIYFSQAALFELPS